LGPEFVIVHYGGEVIHDGGFASEAGDFVDGDSLG